jgi:hypothetical protein
MGPVRILVATQAIMTDFLRCFSHSFYGSTGIVGILDSSVAIVNRLRAWCPRIAVRFPAGQIFASSLMRLDQFWGATNLLFIGYWGLVFQW